MLTSTNILEKKTYLKHGPQGLFFITSLVDDLFRKSSQFIFTQQFTLHFPCSSSLQMSYHLLNAFVSLVIMRTSIRREMNTKILWFYRWMEVLHKHSFAQIYEVDRVLGLWRTMQITELLEHTLIIELIYFGYFRVRFQMILG